MPNVTGVDISNSTLSMSINSSYLLAACVKPSNATNKAITWHSSNENVAKISSGRLICPKGEGTTIITARATDGSGVVSNECLVTVTEAGDVK